MALPNSNEISASPVTEVFNYTLYMASLDASLAENTVDYELGGINIQDPSKGLEYQIWKARISIGGKHILLSAANYAEAPFYEATNYGALTEVSVTFDQNMRPVIAFVEDYIPKLQWYDTFVGAQVVTTFDESTYGRITSPRVSLDEKRENFEGASDIILSYIKDGNLCIRQQIDRYTIEYILDIGYSIPAGYYIHKTGMNTVSRFQWELRKPFNAALDLKDLVDLAASPVISAVVASPHNATIISS